MKEFPKRDKLKTFIAPKMTVLIKLLDNNGKLISTQWRLFMDSIVI